MTDVWQTARWSAQNPDMAGIISTDPAAGASVVVVKSLPPVGQSILLQLNFAGDNGGVCFPYVITGGETVASVAEALCAAIIANTTCSEHNISAQYTPNTSEFGVTNHAGNLCHVSGQVHAECFVIAPGSPALDAGPILFLDRVPEDGSVPANGSNIGQIVFGTRLRKGDPPNVEHAVLACNLLNNDPNDLAAELSLYTSATVDGAPALVQHLAISKFGFAIGNAGILQGSGQNYNPVVVPYSGSFTLGLVRARYIRLFDICWVSLTIPITDGGDGGNFIIADLPFPAAGPAIFSGRAILVSGAMLQGFAGAAPGKMVLTTYDNRYPGPPGGKAETLFVSGAYEIGR